MKDLNLHQFTVQFHHVSAFLFWDRAGHLARRTSALWPNWKIEKAEPGMVLGRSENVQIQFGIDSSFISISGPKGFTPFNEQIAQTVQTLFKTLEIETIDKIGARAIFSRQFKDKEAALLAYRELDLVRWPTRKVFDCSEYSPLNGGSVHLQFEDENTATAVRIAAQNLTLEVGANDDFPELATKRSIDRLIVDVDRQTKKSTSASRFSVIDYLKGYQHLLNRDLPTIIGA